MKEMRLGAVRLRKRVQNGVAISLEGNLTKMQWNEMGPHLKRQLLTPVTGTCCQYCKERLIQRGRNKFRGCDSPRVKGLHFLTNQLDTNSGECTIYSKCISMQPCGSATNKEQTDLAGKSSSRAACR